MNAVCQLTVYRSNESFPRLWDELRVIIKPAPLARIIPTPVGWTLLSCWLAFCLPNHSHACGMNRSLLSWLKKQSESFPRLWDELGKIILFFPRIRIIPTPVGWIRNRYFKPYNASNHSHACGMNPINSTHHNVNNTIYCGFSVLGILNCIFLTPERFRLEFLICNHVIPNACR